VGALPDGTSAISPGPRQAMLLAAGLGSRLRPLTENLPKPLVEIGGRTLLDHALDHLVRAGIERAVVNVHYKPELVKAALAGRDRPAIEVSEEAELLDTGGGVKQALPLLGDCFFVVNSDVLWRDGRQSVLTRLARAFDPRAADAVLLLQPTATAVGYEGNGDFFLDPQGVPRRRREREIAPYLFAGIQLLHRRAFDGIAEPVFSLNRIYDNAARQGRLRGIVHDGDWYHIGTPDGLAATRQRLSASRVGR
jgi:MurNAc alpha-1-phosphate uridylyltransferase